MDYYHYPPHMLRRTYLAAMKQGKRFVCGICRRHINQQRQLTIDHIVPRSKGGTDDFANLQPAHKLCNGWKGNEEPRISFETWPPNERPAGLQNTIA